MKISSSAITMSAKTTLFKTDSKQESLKSWVGDTRPDFERRNNPNSKINPNKKVTLQLSDEAKRLIRDAKAAQAKAAQEQAAKAQAAKANQTDETQLDDSDLSDTDMQKIHLLEKFIELWTGKKIKLTVPKKLQIDPNAPIINLKISQPTAQPAEQPQKQGWGLEYDFHEEHIEKENLSFQSQGIVKTADGKEINFSVQLNMSREFASEQDVHIREGDARLCDPLVVNFDGNAPQLTNTKFNFDLDSDGKSDQISTLAGGSGFLALDLNNDGNINNGSELFGTKSGNGFEDLSKYDVDGNKWIDENDAIFDKLRIWTKDENGNDKLFALGEKGIGAIYLGNVNTNFSLKNSDNELQGQVQKTGIFLKENGTAGTIQHIDLAI
jgi:hypothetical protein